MTSLFDLRKRVYNAEGTLQEVTKRKKESAILIKETTSLRANIDKAIVLLQTVAKETQEQLRFQIEDITQLAIDSCFPKEYTFRVEFELKRGRTEARIFLLKNGYEVDPMTDNGGGLVDLLSFSLRFSAWSLSKSAPVVIMDEPFKWLDPARKRMAFAILKELSIRLKLQVIAVTYDSELTELADQIIHVGTKKEEKFTVSFISKIVKPEKMGNGGKY